MESDEKQPIYSGLESKTALVTGSSKNIGRNIAVSLGEVGMNVGITARSDQEGCEQTVKAVEAAGGQAAIAMGDIGDPDDVTAIVDEVRDQLGPIDVLVNNAAIRPEVPFEDVTLDEWQHVQDVNLRSAFLTCQEVLPDMRNAGGGSIVNVLGLMALQGRRNKSHAAITKTGLIGLTRTLASELGPENVRVNSVVPGRKVKTDRDPNVEREERENYRKIEQATPLRRRGEPEEIASVVRFMASNEASFLTGEVLKVDGGLNTCIDLENIDVGER